MQALLHVAPHVRERLHHTLPPKERRHLDKYLYILSQVQVQYTFNRKEYDRLYNGFAPIQATLLREVCGNKYRAYVDYLLEHSYLETDNHYVPKSKCKQGIGKAIGYRLHPLITMHAPSILEPGKKLAKKIVEVKAKDTYTPRNATERYLKKQLSDFTMDPGALAQIKREGNRITDYTLYHAIQEQQHLFKRGEYGHRLFTTYSSLKRSLRRYLNHKCGLPLFETDIRNSQPLILCALFANHFGGTLPADALHYRSLCEQGQFYDVMMQECQEWVQQEYGHLPVSHLRQAFKRAMFRWVFYCSNRNYRHPIREAFKRLFPNVWHLIGSEKKNDHRKLSQLMQQRERRVMIDVVCTRLIERFEGRIPLLTIHDSIITTEPFKDAVRAEILQAMQELYDLRPSVSLKPVQAK